MGEEANTTMTLITTLAMVLPWSKYDHIKRARRTVKWYLKYTNEVVVVATNAPHRFNDLIGTGRLVISYMDPSNKTLSTMKLETIEHASKSCDTVKWV